MKSTDSLNTQRSSNSNRLLFLSLLISPSKCFKIHSILNCRSLLLSSVALQRFKIPSILNCRSLCSPLSPSNVRNHPFKTLQSVPHLQLSSTICSLSHINFFNILFSCFCLHPFQIHSISPSSSTEINHLIAVPNQLLQHSVLLFLPPPFQIPFNLFNIFNWDQPSVQNPSFSSSSLTEINHPFAAPHQFLQRSVLLFLPPPFQNPFNLSLIFNCDQPSVHCPTSISSIEMGRRKIQIQKIESKDRLKVTFSKRRAGLFKKAQQLSQLSGANVAVLAFSPAGRPFTFSSGGNFDETVDSFLRGQVPEFTSQPMWWESDLSSIADLDQLQSCKEALLKLRENVLARIQQLQHREM